MKNGFLHQLKRKREEINLLLERMCKRDITIQRKKKRDLEKKGKKDLLLKRRILVNDKSERSR